jgi:hypothetical protein
LQPASAEALPLHYESRAVLKAPVEAAFVYLDDFGKLSSHMRQASPMMLGSAMQIETDAAHGRSVGSRVRMHGKIFGLKVALEEVVVEREPPFRKAWETVNARLVVIGRYRLGFELQPQGSACALRVFIEYALPATWPTRMLGHLLGGVYASWCTRRIASDAVDHFAHAAR